MVRPRKSGSELPGLRFISVKASTAIAGRWTFSSTTTEMIMRFCVLDSGKPFFLTMNWL